MRRPVAGKAPLRAACVTVHQQLAVPCLLESGMSRVGFSLDMCPVLRRFCIRSMGVKDDGKGTKVAAVVKYTKER